MKRWLLAFLLSALLLLAGCGGTASDGASSDAVDGEANDAAASQVLTEGAEALTDDELAQAQEAFASERYDEATGASSSTEISCFFTSYYDRAEELSLAEFCDTTPTMSSYGWTTRRIRRSSRHWRSWRTFPFRPRRTLCPR